MAHKWHRLSAEEREAHVKESHRKYNLKRRGAPRPRPRPEAVNAEVEFSDEEREFLVAVDRWKGETGTRFPTLTQLLGVLKSLGYRRVID